MTLDALVEAEIDDALGCGLERLPESLEGRRAFLRVLALRMYSLGQQGVTETDLATARQEWRSLSMRFAEIKKNRQIIPRRPNYKTRTRGATPAAWAMFLESIKEGLKQVRDG